MAYKVGVRSVLKILASECSAAIRVVRGAAHDEIVAAAASGWSIASSGDQVRIGACPSGSPSPLVVAVPERYCSVIVASRGSVSIDHLRDSPLLVVSAGGFAQLGSIRADTAVVDAGLGVVVTKELAARKAVVLAGAAHGVQMARAAGGHVVCQSAGAVQVRSFVGGRIDVRGSAAQGENVDIGLGELVGQSGIHGLCIDRSIDRSTDHCNSSGDRSTTSRSTTLVDASCWRCPMTARSTPSRCAALKTAAARSRSTPPSATECAFAPCRAGRRELGGLVEEKSAS